MTKIRATSQFAAQCCAMRFTLADYGYVAAPTGFRWYVFIYQE